MSVFRNVARALLSDELSQSASQGVALRQEKRDLALSLSFVQERLGELEEQLNEGPGWTKLDGEESGQFSREATRKITRLARAMYLKNPLIMRGVNAQSDYVFGQGVSVQARHDEINDLVQAFWDDECNALELTEHQQLLAREREMQLDGGLVFCFFVDRNNTGAVQLGSIPVEQIEDVITNPEHAKDPWYYKRVWNVTQVDPKTGRSETVQETRYYPDWRYTPDSATRPGLIGTHRIEWDCPIFHVKTGGFSDWKFGVSEVYAALDWALAYKRFLEHRATVAESLSRFSWIAKAPDDKAALGVARGMAGASAMARARRHLLGGESDGVAAPDAGALAAMPQDRNLEPVKVAGATINPDEGRRFSLMVFAALGFPETFFGDVSVGTLATAESLDRPTELQMSNRQRLWISVLGAILGFALFWAVKAPQGPLRHLGRIEATTHYEPGQPARIRERVKWNEAVDAGVDVDFPAIVQAPTTSRIADVLAASAGLPVNEESQKTFARLLLIALGVDDVDELIDRVFEAEAQKPQKPQPTPESTPGVAPPEPAPADPNPQPAKPDTQPANTPPTQ